MFFDDKLRVEPEDIKKARLNQFHQSVFYFFLLGFKRPIE